MLSLISRLLNNLGYIIVIAFFFTKFESAKNIFTREKYSKKDIVILSLFFSGLAIIGTYVGITYEGSLANTRNIGVIVGGILAGPQVGIISGVIAGIHRLFIGVGEVSTIPCSIATILGGYLSGYLYKKSKGKHRYLYGFLGGFIVENLSMFLIIVFNQDKALAYKIVSNLYIPMILANAIGVSVVILIIEGIVEEKEIIAGTQARLALEIANKTLPYFKKGESLNEVCKIILEYLEAKVIVLTDEDQIIASYSESDDYKIDHTQIISESARRVLDTGKLLIANKYSEGIDFNCISKKIKSCIIAPLLQGEKTTGILKIYFDKNEHITARKKYLVIGLSQLIATQLEIRKMENLKIMARDAELKLLQAQINPHFLFNALNTTAFFVRTDVKKAREVIVDLSTYLRFNLENFSRLVPLKLELEQVRAYINIENSRFNKINSYYEIEEETKNIKVPSLIIQPLVENSIKHGILKKREGGNINIKVHKISKGCRIIIEDDGVGIDKEIIKNLDIPEIEKSVGLKNVHNRIKLLYGKGLKIERLEQGTRISFDIKETKI